MGRLPGFGVKSIPLVKKATIALRNEGCNLDAACRNATIYGEFLITSQLRWMTPTIVGEISMRLGSNSPGEQIVSVEKWDCRREVARRKSRQIRRDDAGEDDPVERSGAADAGDAGGDLFDVAQVEQVRPDERTKHTGHEGDRRRLVRNEE